MASSAGRSNDRISAALFYRQIGAGAALAGAAASLVPTAQAATFTVTNLNDSGAGSLRDAIDNANGAAGADIVDFQAGLSGTITLTTGQLSVSDSVTIQGPGSATLSVSGNNASRVFYLYNNSTTLDVTISGLTVTGGNANIGGGIVDFDENLTLDDVSVTGNTASGDGGGLWADGFSMTLTVKNSRISGNTSGDDGGGVYVEDTGGTFLFQNTTISGNQATGAGGGVYFYDPDHDVAFENSTISGNTAGTLGGGVYLYSFDSGGMSFRGTTVSGNSAPDGGGLFLYGIDTTPLVVENTTISGNQATGGTGGGIYIYNAYAGGTIAESTIASNTSVEDGGGLQLIGGTLDAVNSIFAGNAAGGLSEIAGGKGATINVSYSLVADAAGSVFSDVTGNVLDVSAQLGPLQDNGGPTMTMRPDPASPALDAGDPAFAPPPASDQRGQPRVSGAAIDMGAVEVNGGTFQLSASTYSVNENAGTLTATVTRTGGVDPASIVWATTDGSATAPADYAASGATLNFGAADTTMDISVPIVGDGVAEPTETFSLALSNPSPGASIGAPVEATVSILDPGTLALAVSAANVDESAGTVTLTVQRSGGSAGAVSVDYASADGSAAAPGDYGSVSGTLNWADGDSADKSIVVPIVDDTAKEPDETFGIALSNVQGGAALGNASATVTINANDPLFGSVGFDVAAVTVNESDGTVTLSVSRTGGSDGAVSVDYASADGSAVAPGDYGAVSGTLSWADGDSAPQNIVVPLVDDSENEGDENFSVILSNPQGGVGVGTATENVTIGASDQRQALVSIPTLDGPARGLLAVLLGALGGVFLRRRGARDSAALLLLGALAAASASPTQAAGAAQRHLQAKASFVDATISALEVRGSGVHLRLSDGSEVDVAAASDIVDRRATATARTRLGTAALAVGQAVVIKRKDGEAGKLKVLIFDSAEAAQAAAARKRARHP